jgi:RecA/RadA recombinase
MVMSDDDKLDQVMVEMKKSMKDRKIVADIHKATDIAVSSFIPFTIPTGLAELDLQLGGRGGLPAGRMIEYYGFEMCLSGDVKIAYSIRTKEGKVQNTKGGTLERLYQRFHKIKVPVKGSYQRPQTVDSEFYAPSINEDGFIFQNKIEDVVCTGENDCVRLETETGLMLDCTESHRVFNGKGFIRVKDLKEGDSVYIHNMTHYKKVDKCRPYRKEIFVKNHPTASTKYVDKYEYKRLKLYHAIYEADMNNISFETYVNRLNNNELNGLKFLPKGTTIHHKDGDVLNNNIENLIAIDPSIHHRNHAKQNGGNHLRYVAIEDTIKLITPIGKKKTYDLKMASPSHNYIANGFVVHNCGKTTAALHAIAEVQRKGGFACFIDAEHTFSPERAAQCGVNLDKLQVMSAHSIEAIFEIACTYLDIVEKKGLGSKPVLIVVDSVTGSTIESEMTEKKEYTKDQRVGGEAKAIRRGARRLSGILARGKATCILINHAIATNLTMAFGKKSGAAGGHGIKIMSSVRIEFKNVGTLKHKEDGVDIRDGQKISLTIEKLKNANLTMAKVPEVHLKENGFDRKLSLLNAAVMTGWIEKDGVKNPMYTIEIAGEARQFKQNEWTDIVRELGGYKTAYDIWLDRAQQTGHIQLWENAW